ncbi:MAG: hypothetical protein ABIH46_11595 [Chloroflexota bacterium]
MGLVEQRIVVGWECDYFWGSKKVFACPRAFIQELVKERYILPEEMDSYAEKVHTSYLRHCIGTCNDTEPHAHWHDLSEPGRGRVEVWALDPVRV